MTSPSEAFDLLRATLERAGIRYAVGGSWASTAFGEPRFTNDVDVVVEFDEDSLRRFFELLPISFYADAQDALLALRRGRPFTGNRALPISRMVRYAGRHSACEVTLVQIRRRDVGRSMA